MQWYYSKNAAQYGPVSEMDLRAKIASGEVAGTDLVWREGMADWRPVSAVSELAAVPVSSVPTVSPGSSPYAPPVAVPNAYPAGIQIPNYLWQSIVVTILCCWPLGIPAIVYAAKVDGLKAVGDINGAMSASASAKRWCTIALGAWVVLIVIYLLFAVFTFSMRSSFHR